MTIAEKSIQEITKEAYAGDIVAMLLLGECYQAGGGLERDLKEAVKWLKKSAEGGNSRAMRKLADCYYFNKETENFNEALRWYKLAAKNGEAQAAYNLGVLFEQGRRIAADDAAAYKYYFAAGKGGRAEGAYKAGVMLVTGRGVKKDAEKGFKLLLESAGKPGVSPSAFYHLAMCYLSGAGTAADETEGIRLLHIAANAKCAAAETALGDLEYQKGNKENAVSFYVKAAELNDTGAIVRLGNMSYAGDSVPEDKEAAFEFYSRASDLGDPEARRILKAHREEAKKYLKKK